MCKERASGQQLPENLPTQVVGLLEGYLSKTDVLKCRLVRHQWRDAIDKAPFRYWTGDTFYQQRRHITDYKALATILVGSNGLTSFLRDMGHHESNPFPNHAVIFYLPPEQSYFRKHKLSEYYSAFRELAGKFGKHIWRCTYIASEGVTQFPIHFQSLFRLLPNLQSLKIDVSTIPNADYLRLQESLEHFRFPAMTNLNHLTVYGKKCGYLARAFLSIYGHQLESFSSSWDFFDHEDNSPLTCFPALGILPERLSEINISPLGLSVINNTLQHNKSWPLRKLSLGIFCDSNKGDLVPVAFAMRSCIKLLNKFSNTIQYAQFKFLYLTSCIPDLANESALEILCPCGSNIPMDEVNLNIAYPRLQSLEISHGILHPGVFKGFMGKCVALRQLKMNGYRDTEHGTVDAENVLTIPGNQSKWVQKLAEVLWEMLPNPVESIWFISANSQYTKTEYKFTKGMWRGADETRFRRVRSNNAGKVLPVPTNNVARVVTTNLRV